MSFKAEDFMKSPSTETFEKLKKDELLSLGQHLGVNVKSQMRKSKIFNLVLEHMVEEEIFSETALEFKTESSEIEKNEVAIGT